MNEAQSTLDVLASTRTIRRYTDEPVPDEALGKIMFAASRAPSGSNRQAFRFLVMRDGPVATRARAVLGDAARRAWTAKRESDGYDHGSGKRADSPKSRLAAVMADYVDNFEHHPVIVLAGLVRHRPPTPTEGASVYPACQNLLLAARALGYGGAMTMWHTLCEAELRDLMRIPDEVALAATVTLGRPAGRHGPVRRRPLGEFVYEEAWGVSPAWAVDPPGTDHTSAGPPAQQAG